MTRARSLAVGAVGAVSLALALTAGCSSSDPDGQGADVVPPTSATAAPSPSATGEAPGTRQNPVPAGTTVKVGEWEVSLGPTVLNANAQVAAENQFNDPPVAGRQFVMVPVNVTYVGTESGTPGAELSAQFIGSGGNTYGVGGTDDYCGVIPMNLDEVGEMFPGAQGSGNECVSVPSDQVEGGAWIVEESFAIDSNRVFFALA